MGRKKLNNVQYKRNIHPDFIDKMDKRLNELRQMEQEKTTKQQKTMVRIESHLTEEEVAIIEQIAKEEGRSRKKQCEVYLRKMIADYKRKLSN